MLTVTCWCVVLVSVLKKKILDLSFLIWQYCFHQFPRRRSLTSGASFLWRLLLLCRDSVGPWLRFCCRWVYWRILYLFLYSYGQSHVSLFCFFDASRLMVSLFMCMSILMFQERHLRYVSFALFLNINSGNRKVVQVFWFYISDYSINIFMFTSQIVFLIKLRPGLAWFLQVYLYHMRGGNHVRSCCLD